MPTKEELRELFRKLAEPFPEEAIERTKSADTRKGYDTTGIKYQWVANRLNEVLGIGGCKVEHTFNVRERTSRSGTTMFEVTCDLVMRLGEWKDGAFVPFAEASGTGGHVATSEADAKKGSYTNGFKKTAAMFGCRWQAYAGVIDDDNKPAAREGLSEPRARKITAKQLEMLKQLVAELDRDWSSFRAHVRQRCGIELELADPNTASQLITELTGMTNRRRANGTRAVGDEREGPR
ncbi:MAG: hypothetical protein HYV07_14100 [Deltaproteobacteria bacterium]|nr:hypothetical protein [Deltaproteobacteria bacterium]